MSGCGKPGHVTAGSAEGTQWCATCVAEGRESAPWHVRKAVRVYHGSRLICKVGNFVEARFIAETMNQGNGSRG